MSALIWATSCASLISVPRTATVRADCSSSSSMAAATVVSVRVASVRTKVSPASTRGSWASDASGKRDIAVLGLGLDGSE